MKIIIFQLSSVENSIIEESSVGSKASRNITTVPSSTNISTHAFNLSSGKTPEMLIFNGCYFTRKECVTNEKKKNSN